MSDIKQNLLLSNSKFTREKKYWLSKLDGELTEVRIYPDFPPTSQAGCHEEMKCVFDCALTGKLSKLSKNSDLSLYIILLTGLKALLYRYFGSTDITISSPVLREKRTDLTFNKLLPLRDKLTGELSFKECLVQGRETVLQAYENQDYPLERIWADLKLDNKVAHNTLCLLENLHDYSLPLEGVEMVFSFHKLGDTITVKVSYNAELYDIKTIEVVAAHYQNLLNSALTDIYQPIKALQVMADEERARLVIAFNETVCDYPKDKTIIQLFEAEVEQNPEKVALALAGGAFDQLNYASLNARVNQLAHFLRRAGIIRDSIVGIMAEHSVELVIGILGILKAGGAYLPIDPEYPEERINYLLNDSKAGILLTQAHLKSKADSVVTANTQILLLNDERFMAEPALNPSSLNQPSDLVYIIYTSGTTGNPKGVMVTQQGLVNYITWAKKVYLADEALDFALYSSISFDLTVTSIFTPLVSGNKLSIYAGKDKGQLLKDIITSGNTGVVKLTPTHLKLMAELEIDKTNVRKLIVGGEDLKTDLAYKIQAKFGGEVAIFNEYGPTETVVGCMIYRYDQMKDKRASVPIGIPADNVQIYLLDKELNPVVSGGVGEIYISGDGVARGYLNRPELTEERFLVNPFTPGQRMYKTGDLARWLLSGQIEFLGRCDEQLKIRGYRIEPGEIESKLLSYPEMQEVVVSAVNDASDITALTAYFVARKELAISDLKAYLAQDLPEYMIPSYFMQLAKLPLTPNGKIDRRNLPHPRVLVRGEGAQETPTDAVECKLVQLWQQILDVEKVGVQDNFFELGGHSLRGTILAAKVHKEFSVEISLLAIFNFPTIKKLAEYIKSAQALAYAEIKPAGIKEYYPLSSAQKRLFILHQMEGASISYNMPGAMLVAGSIDRERFMKACQRLISRHETLRTAFRLVDGVPVQTIAGNVEFQVSYQEAMEAEVPEIIQRFIRPFNLNEAPLLRIELISLGVDKYVLIFDTHHIISDGVSLGILVQELTALYQGADLPALRIQYKDFAEWQNELNTSPVQQQKEEFWLNTLSGEIPLLNLPLDYPRPAVQSFKGGRITFTAAADLSARLTQLALETESTLYMVILAAYTILLAKYTGQKDIIIGSPIAGRPHADLEQVIGMFVNVLAMRNYPEGEKTCRDFLLEVKDRALHAFAHQDYPFEELVEKLNARRDLSRNPLFDTVFAFQNTEVKAITLPGVSLSPYPFATHTAKFDLTLHAVEKETGLAFGLEYCAKLFKETTVERLAQHLINLLHELTAYPDKLIKDVEILTEEEKYQQLVRFNETSADYPREKTIQQLFEEQVYKTPNQVALAFEEDRLTYQEVNKRSNQLARFLRAKGVVRECIVAIMVERCFDMVIGALAILKAGGAYLPVDPSYPEERIRFMLEDSGTELVLTEEHVCEGREFSQEIVNLNESSIYSSDQTNLSNLNSVNDLLYIIYTSGTTGKAKGSMIEHRNLVRLMINDRMLFDFTAADVWTMFHSFSFDFSVWEMYGALLYGGKLLIIPKLMAQNPAEYLQLLKKEQVTVLNQTPTAFYALLHEEMKTPAKDLKLRYIIFGGEALKPAKLKEWKEKYPLTRLINMYGITETTVHVTFKEITAQEMEANLSNIGRPIPTLSVYILDENSHLLPLGAAGELCVGGAGVSRGYLNRPELTCEKFVDNPYKPGDRLYKSGDLARFLPDGELEYLGRIDQQVKIRGFRIEPTELENRLLKHPAVEEAVVLVRNDTKGENYLCSYFVAKTELLVSELREYLALELPDYMIPAFFVQLVHMPLTANGKVDRKALPAPADFARGDYLPPADEVEERLAAIWQEVLDIEKIGVGDNFFELGGHSLKAINLLAQIHKEFAVEIPLKEIFRLTTVREQAEYLKGAEKNHYLAIEPVQKAEYYPLSPAQRRIFIIAQMAENSTSYNIPQALLLAGKLDKERFTAVFAQIVKRHEALRTSFELLEGNPVQRVDEDAALQVNYWELALESELSQLVADFIKPFDLRKAPLFRVCLVKLTEEKHLLLFDLHHIIADGTSFGILLEEFTQLYAGEQLPALRIHYKDFAVWQNAYMQSNQLKKQQDFWLNALTGEIPALELPLDFPRSEKRSFSGETLSLTFSREMVEGLEQLALSHNLTVNNLLFSLYALLLHKYSSQQEIIVGSLVAGRRHADLRETIGMFANFLPVRMRVLPDQTFLEFLQQANEILINAYDNQDYPFDEMVERIIVKQDPARNPFFDTMLIFHNEFTAGEKLKLEGLNVTRYDLHHQTAKLDWKIDAFLNSEKQLVCVMEYNTKLFTLKTIRQFLNHFHALISETSKNPVQKICDINILTGDEKQEIAQKIKLNGGTKKPHLQLAISATFTAEPLESHMKWWCKEFDLPVEVEFAPYNQVFQQLLAEDSLINTNRGVNVILVRFEDWLREDHSPEGEQYQKLEHNLNELLASLKNCPNQTSYFVGIFPIAPHLHFTPIMLQHLENLTQCWQQALAEMNHVTMVDFTDLAELYEIDEIFDPVKDQIGHLPFSDEYYAAVGTFLARKVLAWKRQQFKVIVTDCDNTLWSGVCGEDGALKVKISGPYAEMQKFLLEKAEQGMLLAICSKNNEPDVLEVLAKNPEMLLKGEHFVASRINWQAKSANLRALAAELNLGLDSFIFIDDSPTECSEVMTNCPEVLTLQLPEDANQIPAFLKHVWAFDRYKVTAEDRQRTEMYLAERKRQDAQNAGVSLQEFLRSLELKMSMTEVEKAQLGRVSQLTLRTNQFNLSTIRRSEEEIARLMSEPNTRCLALEVADRFGDYGLVGVVITKVIEAELWIDTLLLSCRVLGRGVENASLLGLKQLAGKANLTTLMTKFYPTAKNRPALEFLEKTNWEKVAEAGKYSTYRLPVAAIPDSLDFIDCYFASRYTKKSKPAEVAEINLDHIGLGVKDISKAREDYQALGFECSEIIHDPLQQAYLLMCRKKGFDPVELVAAAQNDQLICQALQGRQDIPYHLCYQMRGFEDFLTTLHANKLDYEVISPAKSAILFNQREVMFIFVKDVGLIELLLAAAKGLTDVSTTEEAISANILDMSVKQLNSSPVEKAPHQNLVRLAVPAPEKALMFFQLLGYRQEKSVHDHLEQALKITLSKPVSGKIELLIPLTSNTSLSNFLAEYGPHLVEIVQLEAVRSGQARNNWQIETVNEANLLHKSYLLPLRNYSGRHLLNLPVYQTIARTKKSEMRQPINPIETKLLTIWRDVLRVQEMGVTDNFFELGGHSLKAASLLARVHREFNVIIPLSEIFKLKTVREMGEFIVHAEKIHYTAIEPVMQKEYYPVSSAQKRLYILSQLESTGIVYNMPGAIIIEGSLDYGRFADAFHKLILRHETLRTAFDFVDGGPVQKVQETVEFALESAETVEEQVKANMKTFIQPFALSKAPLIRAKLLKIHPAKHILIFDLHHIISDGISMGILIQEFGHLYAGLQLPELRLHYKDFAVWQNNLIKTGVMKKQEEYWLKVFTGELPLLNLPLDYPRPFIQDFMGERLTFSAVAQLTDDLRQLAARTETTLYMVLFAAYAILLSHYANQDDIIIGTPIAGRPHADLEKVIGMFVNTLAIRTYPEADKTFSEFLQEVKVNTLQAFENQDYQFEELVEKLNLQKDFSRNPLFSTLFALQNISPTNLEIAGLRFKQYEVEYKIAKFDLTFQAFEKETQIGFSLDYATKLFKRETVERMIKDYLSLLEAIVQNEANLIKDFKLGGEYQVLENILEEDFTFNF